MRAVLEIFHLPPRFALLLGLSAAVGIALWPFAGGWGVAAGCALLALVIAHGMAVPGSPVFVGAIARGPRTGDRVALTFDDGPHPVFTPRVLDALRRHGARASFFVIGRFVRDNAELVRRVVAEGHGVGTHSFSHARTIMMHPPRKMAGDVRAGIDAVAAVTGVRPRLYRQPMGLVTRWVDLAVRWNDVTLVAWSVRGGDNHLADDAAAAARALAERLAPGDIVVLHDGADHDPDGEVCRRRREWTLALLDPLLAAMKARGLASVPVEELLALDARSGHDA